MWNDLPVDVVTASSVKAFKNKLEANLKNLLEGRKRGLIRTYRPLAFVFLLFFYTSVKNRLLNRVQAYVPLPFMHIYMYIKKFCRKGLMFILKISR